MSMMTTERLGLPLLAAAQAQKEITHNEALLLLDMLVQPVAESADLAAPPGSPATGACWIVAAAGSGDWSGKDGQFAIWTGAGWRFAPARAGWRAWVVDRAAAMHFDGMDWGDGEVRADGFYLTGERIVTVQQAAIADPAGGALIDSEARAAIVAVLAAMRAHGLIDS